jgi:homoaconitase/3-isopropylmalate dehydratase large subunit
MLHELPLGAMRLYAVLRVHQSDQALVNDGGCLSSMAAAWICVNEGVVDIFSYTGCCGLHPECSPCVGAAYYAVHVGAAQVVAREGAAVSEQGYLMA